MPFRGALVAIVLLCRTEALAAQRSLLGEVAVEASQPKLGVRRVALADSSRTIVLEFLDRDVVRWRSQVTALQSRRTAPRGQTPLTARLEEPGVDGGNLAVTRRDSAGRVAWSLFAVDRGLESIRSPLEPGEVRALVALVAGTPVRPPPRRQRPPPSARRN